MASKGYTATKKSTTIYEFISIGPKGQITKRIEFTPLRKRGYYNVAFGDVMKDGRVSDAVYSNNRDIVKVIATVIDTMKDFLKENSDVKLVFTGSTMIVQIFTNESLAVIMRLYRSNTRSQHWQKMRRVTQQK